MPGQLVGVFGLKPKIGIIAVVLLVFLSGCTSNPDSNPNANTDAPLKEFSVQAKQFEFVPSTITVTQGDRVKLLISSSDVQHGFSLPEFNVNKTINPGSPVVVEFVADKTGTFTFSCSVFCGEGHSEMQGTFIVQEK